MGKKLCTSKTNYAGKKYTTKIIPPHFVCDKCGRVANAKKHLCSPEALKNID